MIYQRAAAEADQKIANTLDQRMERLAVMPATRCHPASPITRWQSFLPQMEGTGTDATLWGC